MYVEKKRLSSINGAGKTGQSHAKEWDWTTISTSCCCSVTQSCLTLCDPIGCSTPGLLVPHHLPKSAQVHVHCIGDVILPSHPLMPFSPSTLNLSQHQGLFQWVNCSHQMTKMLGASASTLSVLPMSIQCWLLRIDWFDLLALQGTLRSLLQHYSVKA